MNWKNGTPRHRIDLKQHGQDVFTREAGKTNTEQRTMSRRTVLKSGCALMLGGVFGCGLGTAYATELEPGWIEITRPRLSLPDWPTGLKGLTVAQLSDLHLGNVDVEHVRHCVEMTNQLGADLIFLTGDFISGPASRSRQCARELAALRARHGVFAVLGNHDIWGGASYVSGQLIHHGITVLRNQRQRLDLDGEQLWLLGIEDTGYTGYSRGQPMAFQRFRTRWQSRVDAMTLLLDGIPDSDPRLLLVHNPDFTEMLPPGRIDLALCGHTHGGQVVLPLIGAPVVPSYWGQKYASGLVQGNGLPVYVNRGVGLASLPIRLNCRPEITLLRFE